MPDMSGRCQRTPPEAISVRSRTTVGLTAHFHERAAAVNARFGSLQQELLIAD